MALAAPLPASADDECGSQLLPGDPETVTCDPNDSYPDGITYSSDGDLTLEVAPNDPVNLDVNEAGVNVTGNGADNIFWDSGGFTSGDIRGTGIVLDYLSDTGNADILVGGTIRGTADATHAVRAESTGGGDVSVTTLGNINPAPARFSGDPDPSGIGIEALTTSGAIAIDAAGEVRAAGSATHAIRALSDSGDISVTTDGRVTGGSSNAIQAVSGGGDISITTSARVSNRGSSQAARDLLPDAVGIQAATSGSGNLTITASDQVRGNAAGIDASAGTGLLTIDLLESGDFGQVNTIRIATGGEAVVNVGSGRNVFAIDTSTSFAGTTVFQATGTGTFTLNNNGGVRGEIDFSGLGGGYTFNNNAGAQWRVGPSSTLGAGSFNNAGTVILRRGNLVSATGTTFTGSGDGVLEMNETVLDGTPAGCGSVIAGCLELAGGATAGQTAVLVNALNNRVKPQINAGGIVLIDVAGGSSAPEHFVLHEDSTDYTADPRYGAVLKSGDLFDYALLYDPDNQRHVLASVPQDEALEYLSFMHQTLSVWHTTSDAVAGRQAELRNGAADRGAWFRIVGEDTKRRVAPTLNLHGNRFEYGREYSFSTRAAIFGSDLVADDNHVFGVHIGFVSSDLETEGSSTRDDASDTTFGAYGSWWHDNGLSLDGTVNVNFLSLDHKIEEFHNSSSKVESLGARLEAGWRLSLAGEALYVQPLATAAYVSADIKDLRLRQYTMRFEDTDSQRAALGLRLGGETALNRGGLGKIGYWLTGRAWEEYADDANLQYAVEDGDDLVIPDDLSGTFEEVGFGVNVSNADDSLSAYLSGGAKFTDNLEDNYNVSIGARLRW